MRKRPSFTIGVLVTVAVILNQEAAGASCASWVQPETEIAPVKTFAGAPAQLEQEALANVLEFARHILWPSKNEFGWLSCVGLLAVPAGGLGYSVVKHNTKNLRIPRSDESVGFPSIDDDFGNVRLVKQSQITSDQQGAPGHSLERFIGVEAGQEWLHQIKTLMIVDTDLRAKILEIQRLLHLTGLFLRTGASDITKRLGIEGDLSAELELGVDSDDRGNVSIATVRQHGGNLFIDFNVSNPESLMFLAAVHEITEAYETVKALRSGMSEPTWHALLQGLGSSTSSGYFHWKGVEAEIGSAFFAALPRGHQVNLAFELFSIGFGLLGLYRAQLANHPADAALLRGAIKDLKRLERITTAPAYTALKMDIWQRWRQLYGRNAPLNAQAAMTEANRQNHLVWVNRFLGMAHPKFSGSLGRALSSKKLRSIAGFILLFGIASFAHATMLEKVVAPAIFGSSALEAATDQDQADFVRRRRNIFDGSRRLRRLLEFQA